ncbi:MAG: thiamine pyrophosphokinase [Acidimicrobiia bacterium]|nr:MAG: thiamine pyrophosphokinase [Acidimicrobiia bacterium]
MEVAVVVTGGAGLTPAVLEELPDRPWVVAADSGVDHAVALGLRVDLVVGDLDSATPDALAESNAPVERHPADKDATDLELALRAAASRPGIRRVIVLGGHGGRLDHLLGNAAVIASPQWAHLQVEWVAGSDRAVVIHDVARLHGTPGDPVSLVPVGGPVTGVHTHGLRWPLRGATLSPFSSLGVSNRMLRSVAEVRVGSGVLLAVQPGAVV